MDTQSRRIVVAVTTGLDSYQRLLLTGIREVLGKHQLSLIAYVEASPDPALSPTLVSLLDKPSTCAVIATSMVFAEQDTQLSELVAERRLPVVYIGRQVPGRPCVLADNAQAMTALMRLVLDDCGVRAPVLVQGLAHQPDHTVREEIFRSELRRRGLRVDEDLVFRGHSDPNIIQHEMRLLLQRRRDMDAVITLDDRSALVAVESLLDAGLRVPDDVVVTGFDNDPIGTINWPSLTTVDQCLREQGAAAARVIVDSLAGVTPAEPARVRCEVIRRGSTAIGRGAEAAVPQTTEGVAQAARAYLKTQGEVLRMSRVLKKCRTLDEVCRVLPESLAGLGIRRSFLVVYDQLDKVVKAHGTVGHAARLVLHCGDRTTHSVPDTTFPSGDLLPQSLLGELHQGFLGFQPLKGTHRPLGHLLMEHDQTFGPVPFAEALCIDLGRTLEALLSAAAVAEHSAALERLVARRTQELRAEVAVRRQIEQELREANAALRRLAVIDGLTGVANRTALDEHFERYWREHVDEQAELAVLMVDVDLFKPYNDLYGHLLGDRALRTVAMCLERAARSPRDLVCRFGGEEFLMVLPFSDGGEAMDVAERFSRLLADAAIPHDGSPIASVITASVGIAVLAPAPDNGPEMAISAADRALYRAKTEGRNRIVISASPAGVPPG